MYELIGFVVLIVIVVAFYMWKASKNTEPPKTSPLGLPATLPYQPQTPYQTQPSATIIAASPQPTFTAPTYTPPTYEQPAQVYTQTPAPSTDPYYPTATTQPVTTISEPAPDNAVYTDPVYIAPTPTPAPVYVAPEPVYVPPPPVYVQNATGCSLLKGLQTFDFYYPAGETGCAEYKAALTKYGLNPCTGSEWALKCPGNVFKEGFYRFGDPGNTRDCYYTGDMTCAKLVECSKQFGVQNMQTVLCASTPTKILA